MYATIHKYAYWPLILAMFTMPIVMMGAPFKLFPQWAKANSDTAILLGLIAFIALVAFLFKRAINPLSTLTLSIANGEWTLTKEGKVVIQQPEQDVALRLGQYKTSTTNHKHQLMLSFYYKNHTHMLTMKVEESVTFHSNFSGRGRGADYHINDMFGYYGTDGKEAKKILTHYGHAGEVSFR